MPRLDENEWAEFENDLTFFLGPGSTPPRDENTLRVARIIGAILDLRDARAAADEASARMDALKAAREYVNSLPSEQPNSRGYRDTALKAEQRISEELRVARFLLEGKNSCG